MYTNIVTWAFVVVICETSENLDNLEYEFPIGITSVKTVRRITLIFAEGSTTKNTIRRTSKKIRREFKTVK